jgi:hypothetical protein
MRGGETEYRERNKRFLTTENAKETAQNEKGNIDGASS